MPPLRIALVLGTLEIGGTERQVVRLAKELADRGHRVHVIALSGGGPLAAELEGTGIELHVLAYGGIRFRNERRQLRPWVVFVELFEIVRLWRLLVALRPHVCHAFLFWAYTLALPLARLARVPVRLSGRRGLPPSEPAGWPRRLLDRLSNASATALVANSSRLADQIAALEAVSPTRFHVIHNGVDLPAAVADPGKEPAAGVVVANLIAYKGHADLLRALALVADPPRMTFVGEGPERENLERLTAQLHLSGVVCFAGRRAGAERLLPEFQFAVLPSHHEGLPNVVLEAMAAGLAVVTTDVGGVREVAQDGVSALIVPPRDVTALAAALSRISTDAALRVGLGRRGRAEAERLDWAACSSAHEALYRNLLASV